MLLVSWPTEFHAAFVFILHSIDPAHGIRSLADSFSGR